ncbi:hypothetical protein ACFWVB_20200 [Streptomyces microflavus]|uniref:hypothetical protein n=1 Tax=Streptomyces microflavus TaxID=1919 RepID=UPI00366319EC
MAVAGCGTNTARIVDRTGGTISDAHVLTEIEWTRSLDETSTARVVINPSGDCCERLGEVRSWRHSLAIWRDGTLAWSGPIIQVDWRQGEIEIFASDISAWLARRVPHSDMVFTDTDLMVPAQALIEDGFAPDDPGHTVQVVGPARVRGSRSYTTDVGQTLDHLLDLADTGIDFTVIGQTFVLLPEDHSASIGRLDDGDFPDGLVVSEDGASLGTRWVVAGGQNAAVIGSAGGSHPYYGLLERYLEESSVPDVASAEAAAASKLRTSLPVPVFIDSQEVTLSPQAAVDVAQLVPGWCIDVTSAQTCRQISQRLKIVGVKVVETGGSGDTPGSESVQVQVAATGAEATV